jgi:hypothetical protein
MTRIERVRSLISGNLPDRPPLYDVIRNDAVVEYFGGSLLTSENAADAVRRAHAEALDATKGFYRLPHFEPGSTEIDTDGRKVTHQRWTIWTEHTIYPTTGDYVAAKLEATAEPWDWTEEDQRKLDISIAEWQKSQDLTPDLCRDFFFQGPPRLDDLFPEVGLEAFSYYMADCPDVIHRQIDFRFTKIIQAMEHAELPDAVMIVNEACDMAFKGGLLFPPSFLRESFIPGYTRFCDAVHRKGRAVLFHSDGNLMPILEDLIEAGTDLLHPLEPLAGMDTGKIHRLYPDLILVGSIDVSQLLPYGTKTEIRDAVRQNIEAAEGKIMIGSSTEVHNEVPLENYLALHETVLDYRF